MSYAYFSHNGTIEPTEHATVRLDNIAYAYGYGVYETIRVTNGQPRFIDAHCARLMESARIIEIAHTFSVATLTQAIADLIKANDITTCNLKITLVGGAQANDAELYILCLNPHYIDRKLYRTGVHLVTERMERPFPHAKSLNMLPSYLAYKHAVQAGAHDALLLDHSQEITEGTRSNFFVVRADCIISPPADSILLGVTRDNVIRVAQSIGLPIREEPVMADKLLNYDGAFVTSTSAKVLPVRSIDTHVWPAIVEPITRLSKAFDAFLETA
jgi:branched-chain amino acid aminotransferase